MNFDTIHQFHFGLVTDGDTTDTFEENGKDYYFRVTYDGEHVFIEDTCNRMIPISKEDLSGLGLTLFAIKGIVSAEQQAKDLYWKKVRETAAVAEHFANE